MDAGRDFKSLDDARANHKNDRRIPAQAETTLSMIHFLLRYSLVRGGVRGLQFFWSSFSVIIIFQLLSREFPRGKGYDGGSENP